MVDHSSRLDILRQHVSFLQPSHQRPGLRVDSHAVAKARQFFKYDEQRARVQKLLVIVRLIVNKLLAVIDINAGIALGVDYALTVSCYQATAEGLACGLCDSCRLRRQGFAEAGIEDPTRYS